MRTRSSRWAAFFCMIAAGGFGASVVLMVTQHWTAHTGLDWRVPVIAFGIVALGCFVGAIMDDDAETLIRELDEKQKAVAVVEARLARKRAYEEAAR